LRVATFNLAGGVGADDRFYSRRGSATTRARVEKARGALEEVARWVREEELDVVALQEVDVCWSGAETLRQAEALVALLGGGWRQVYLPCFAYDVGWLGRWTVTTGVATLSRREIVGVREHAFSQRRRGVRGMVKGAVIGAKAALEVMVEGDDGRRRVRVVNAHLTHDDDRQKEYELETLLAVCAGEGGGGDVCVLAGDLNTTPLATRSASMREAAHFATDQCFEVFARYAGMGMRMDPRLPCTYPAGGTPPDVKLDYVVVFGAETVSAETVHPPLAGSNHLPVSVTIT
jgi:endonuclease/exonuclease/phosphatase family metal-dependent hydrolase